MSTTVLEALQNAQFNFETLGNSGLKTNGIFLIAKDQLDNAIEALKNGKAVDDVLQEHLGKTVDTGA